MKAKKQDGGWRPYCFVGDGMDARELDNIYDSVECRDVAREDRQFPKGI